MATEIKALRVKDVYEDMKNLVKQGKGDYLVFVADDEEGNGYHALWFKAEEAKHMNEDCRNYVEEYNHDISLCGHDRDKAVYMG